MEAHRFHEDKMVQMLCLTLLGEMRLCYQSLEPLGETTWAQLQNLFRQRYTKLGNTCEQLFHAWRSFTFDENTETIDSYMTRIRQVTNLLGYGEPQILEIFKNTLPTKLYWVLFPIENLRQVVDTAKIILTKEKLDKQLMGQTSTSPFLSIREGTDKRVSFNARDEFGDKIDKLTVVMSKLSAVDNHERRPFKLHIYIRVDDRIDPMAKGDISIEQIIGIEAMAQKEIQDRIIEVVGPEETLEGIIDKIVEKGTETKGIVTMTAEIGIDQEREHL